MATFAEVINPVTLYDAILQDDDALVRDDGPFVKLAKQGQVGKVEGDVALYDRWEFDRGLAPLTVREATPTEAPAHKEDVIRQGMFHIVEEFRFPWSQLAVNQRQPTNSANTALFNTDAMFRVQTKLSEMVGRVRRTAERLVSQCFLNPGGFNINTIGATSISENIAYGQPVYNIPAGRKWSVNSTRVLSAKDQMLGIRQAMNAAGRAPHRIITDLDTMGALIGNTEVREYASSQAAGLNLDYLRDAIKPFDQEAAMEGASAFDVGSDHVFRNMAGIEFWHEWSHGFEDNAGTFTRYMQDPKGKAIVLPRNLKDTLGWAEGPAALPGEAIRGIIGGDMMGKLFEKQFGLTTYAYMETKYPWGIILHVEYHFNFFIMAPKRVLLVDKILAD